MAATRRKTEHELIASFTRAIERAGIHPRGLVVGVGDDAAVVRPERGKDTLLTKDVLVEGRHFERRWLGGRALGWRLAAVNLSDIAAMGGQPRYALFSLVAPPDVRPAYLGGVVRGIVAHLACYGAALVGGNVSSTDGPLVCDMTLSGVCEKGAAWRRRARGGDAVVVAGEVGTAAVGLSLLSSGGGGRRGRFVAAYAAPQPRLDVAVLARGVGGVRGAIDVSDGLSSDLIHVCRASGLGCAVDGSALPIARGTVAYCRDRGVDPIEWSMRGGEDYALVLAVAPRIADGLCDRIVSKLGVPAAVVGRFTRARGVYRLRRPGGAVDRFTSTGWDHFT